MENKLVLTPEEARDIVYSCKEGWNEVESKVVDTTRWSVIHDGIFERESDNTFWQTSWSTGATEYQDEQAFEYETEVPFFRMVQVEVIQKAWVEADKVDESVATDYEYLLWFYQMSDFGPADGDVRHYMEQTFTEITGKQVPEGFRDKEDE